MRSIRRRMVSSKPPHFYSIFIQNPILFMDIFMAPVSYWYCFGNGRKVGQKMLDIEMMGLVLILLAMLFALLQVLARL